MGKGGRLEKAKDFSSKKVIWLPTSYLSLGVSCMCVCIVSYIHMYGSTTHDILTLFRIHYV